MKKLAMTATMTLLASWVIGNNLHAQTLSLGRTNTIASIAPLDSWSFNDNTNWTSDKGFGPTSSATVSFPSWPVNPAENFI